MHVEANRGELYNCVAEAAAVAKRASAPMPILQCVHLHVEGGHLLIGASDLEVTARGWLPVQSPGALTCCVRAEALARALKAGKGEAAKGVRLELHEDKLHVLLGTSTVRLPTMPAGDMPVLPAARSGPAAPGVPRVFWDGERAGALRRKLEYCLAAAHPHDVTRKHMQGVRADVTRKVMYATDGHRLHLASERFEAEPVFPTDAGWGTDNEVGGKLLPTPLVQTWLRLLKLQPDAQSTLCWVPSPKPAEDPAHRQESAWPREPESGTWWLSVGHWVLEGRRDYVMGPGPDWAAVRKGVMALRREPETSACSVVASELHVGVNAVIRPLGSLREGVGIELNGGLVLRAEDAEDGSEASTAILCQDKKVGWHAGPDAEGKLPRFQPRFLLDALEPYKTSPKGRVDLAWQGPLDPLVAALRFSDGEWLEGIVMPLRW